MSPMSPGEFHAIRTALASMATRIESINYRAANLAREYALYGPHGTVSPRKTAVTMRDLERIQSSVQKIIVKVAQLSAAIEHAASCVE